MDSSCIQDKCHAHGLRSVGRAATTLMVSRGADISVFHEAEARKELCHKHPLCSRSPFFIWLSVLSFFRCPPGDALLALILVFPEGVQGFHLALLLIPNPQPQGLNHQFPPMSPTWLVAARWFHNHQRDGNLTFQKTEWRLCVALWICSFGVLGLGLGGWPLIGFEEIWDWIPVNSIRSQKKNGVTEGLLIFDPSPLMAAVITVGGCSEQECIVSQSFVDSLS